MNQPAVMAQQGVAWAYGIPRGWMVRRLRDAVTLMNGYPFDSAGFNKMAGTRIVRIRDVLNTEDVTFYAGADERRARIADDDLLIGMDGDFNVVLWEDGPAVLNQRLCCLRPRKGTDLRFIAYVLPLPLKIIHDLTFFTTVKHLSSKQVLDLCFADPGSARQTAIADFLDKKTASIDAFIAKKVRLIELLQEKRQALITQAVTKGLDPNVPMKDSGIGWLGEIPAHWHMRRLKQLSHRISGRLVYQPAQYFSDEGVPFIMANNVSERGVVLHTETKFIPADVNERFARHALRAGDVVTVRVGAPGVTAVVPPEADGLNCGSLMIIRQNRSFDSGWLTFVMNSPVVRAQIDLVQYGAAQEQINITDAVNFLVPTPPPNEQSSVTEFLHRSSRKLDQAVDAVRGQLDKLREYRQALISAAVTGKLDVTKALDRSASLEAP